MDRMCPMGDAVLQRTHYVGPNPDWHQEDVEAAAGDGEQVGATSVDNFFEKFGLFLNPSLGVCLGVWRGLSGCLGGQLGFEALIGGQAGRISVVHFRARPTFGQVRLGQDRKTSKNHGKLLALSLRTKKKHRFLCKNGRIQEKSKKSKVHPPKLRCPRYTHTS